MRRLVRAFRRWLAAFERVNACDFDKPLEAALPGRIIQRLRIVPFTLAHPAAVLPFRRLCPGWLSFPALVIGSIVPDFAYVIDDFSSFPHVVRFLFGPPSANWAGVRDNWEWSNFSHTLAGSFAFGLPSGILLLVVFLALESAVVFTLPNPYRDALLPLCRRRRPSATACVGSLLIGIWLHLAWDSFTHSSSGLARHWAFLHGQLITFQGFSMKNINALWLVSSGGGILVLLVAGIRFLRDHGLPPWVFDRREARRYLLWSAILLLPVFAAVPTTVYFMRLEHSNGNLSYLFHVFSEYYLVILGFGLIAVGLVAKQLIAWDTVRLRPCSAGSGQTDKKVKHQTKTPN